MSCMPSWTPGSGWKHGPDEPLRRRSPGGRCEAAAPRGGYAPVRIWLPQIGCHVCRPGPQDPAGSTDRMSRFAADLPVDVVRLRHRAAGMRRYGFGYLRSDVMYAVLDPRIRLGARTG